MALDIQIAAHQTVLLQVIAERDRLEHRLAAIEALLATVPEGDPDVARALALARGKRPGRQLTLTEPVA